MADSVNRFQIIGMVLSPAAALVSAGIAGWVTLNTQQMQAELTDRQGQYNRALEELRTENQKAIAKLQEETKREIAQSSASLSRAEVFARLVDSLSEPSKAGFALLALWQLNPHPEDRSLIVAAALGAPKGSGVRALKSLALVAEVDERVKEIIRKAELQGNTALAESGKEVIGKFSADDVVAITLDGVLKADDRRLSLIDSSIEKLIDLASRHAAARSRIDAAITEVPKKAPLLNYVLYAAGNTSRLDALLGPAEKDLRNFPAIAEYVRFGKFREQDMARIVKLSLDFLDAGGEPQDEGSAINSMRWVKWQNLDGKLRDRARDRLRAYALEGAYPWGRADALEALGRMEAKLALEVVSRLLAAGEKDNTVRGRIVDIVDTGRYSGTALRTTFNDLNLPPIDGPAAVWRQWRAANGAALAP